MADIPYKFDEIVVNATVKSHKLNLKWPEGGGSKPKNAYRLKSLKIQIDDLDVIDDNDLLVKIQFTYKDLAAGTLLTIDDVNEILTLALRDSKPTVGTNAGSGEEKEKPNMGDVIRDQGWLFLDGRDFNDVYIVRDFAYINLENSGQDGNETFHCEMKGKYVHLNEDDIQNIKDGNTLD